MPNETYYANETNGVDASYHKGLDLQGIVDWKDENLAKITRLRLLTDPGFPLWDVSYCHGKMKDGTDVRVELPFSQLPRKTMMKTLIAFANKDGVNLKKLGVFNAISKLW